jgi:hypothetical protein
VRSRVLNRKEGWKEGMKEGRKERIQPEIGMESYTFRKEPS